MSRRPVLKMKRSTRVVLIIAIVVGMPISLFVGRGVLRCFALHKFLKVPVVVERTRVVPTRLTLMSIAPVHPVNLGYATFDTGSTNAISLEARGDGVTLVLSNRDVKLVFQPPSAPAFRDPGVTAKFTDEESLAHPKTVAFLELRQTNALAGQISSEETQPASWPKIFLMSEDDFLLYSAQIGLKGMNKIGTGEVEYFETSTIRGIVRIGRSRTDRQIADAFIYSLGGTREAGFILALPDKSPVKIEDLLAPIIRSFRFTADRVDNREEVKTMIQQAGIVLSDKADAK
jgi:hypothetical protein